MVLKGSDYSKTLAGGSWTARGNAPGTPNSTPLLPWYSFVRFTWSLDSPLNTTNTSSMAYPYHYRGHSWGGTTETEDIRYLPAPFQQLSCSCQPLLLWLHDGGPSEDHANSTFQSMYSHQLQLDPAAYCPASLARCSLSYVVFIDLS